jgi:hypothetical protein
MTDALAAVVDVRLRPPRQGDADDGHGLLLDEPGYDRWASLLATGAALFGPAPWWPAAPPSDVRTALWTRLATRPLPGGARPERRPSLFADAGMALLRDHQGQPDELWCRADHGPHGYLSIAAHAHADALAVEVRVGGVDVLADPGTYCYAAEPTWRSYFRSTLAHNTLEVDGVDQSVAAGPHLWTRQATAASAHRPSTAAASGWNGGRASWSSRTASTAAAPTTAAWPSTSAPRSPAPSRVAGPSWPGSPTTAAGAPTWHSPTAWSGGAWKARPTRPPAGTRPRSAYACPRSRCSGPAGSVPARP